MVSFSEVLGRNWHIWNWALRSLNPRRNTDKVPPLAFGSASSAFTNVASTPRWALARASPVRSGLTRLANCSGWVSASHPNTSSGNNANSRS